MNSLFHILLHIKILFTEEMVKIIIMKNMKQLLEILMILKKNFSLLLKETLL